MNNNLKALCEELTQEIQNSYEESVTVERAEKLAARFLYAQLAVADELAKVDLDARNRKTGVKAIRAAVYLEEARKTDKKPSDVMLEAIVNSTDLVQSEQEAFDSAEVERDQLQSYFNTFRECHIYYRGIGKGRFD